MRRAWEWTRQIAHVGQGYERQMAMVIALGLGVLSGYAVDAWRLKRWLMRERPVDWRDWVETYGWRHVAIDWIVFVIVTALVAAVVMRR